MPIHADKRIKLLPKKWFLFKHLPKSLFLIFHNKFGIFSITFIMLQIQIISEWAAYLLSVSISENLDIWF